LSRVLTEPIASHCEGLVRAAISREFPQIEITERRRKDGSVLRVSVTRSPVRDASGQIVEILECGKLPAWQDCETTGQAGFQQVAEQMPIILWTTDLNLRITSYCGAGLPGNGAAKQSRRTESDSEHWHWRLSG
jgi:PAS domain-containing protein